MGTRLSITSGVDVVSKVMSNLVKRQRVAMKSIMWYVNKYLDSVYAICVDVFSSSQECCHIVETPGVNLQSCSVDISHILVLSPFQREIIGRRVHLVCCPSTK